MLGKIRIEILRKGILRRGHGWLLTWSWNEEGIVIVSICILVTLIGQVLLQRRISFMRTGHSWGMVFKHLRRLRSYILKGIAVRIHSCPACLINSLPLVEVLESISHGYFRVISRQACILILDIIVLGSDIAVGISQYLLLIVNLLRIKGLLQ